MVLAVVVLLGVVAVLVVVLLLQPRAPYVAVRAASLYALVGVLPLAYVGRAQGAPLGDAGSAAMEAALRDGVVPFRVEGEARTRWKVAGIVGVDQWTRLACQLRFFWPNDTVLPFRCSSKSKLLFF
ncbi:late embryogenesis abundant protein [Zea mays]|uniref:Late embryogenesis abundant protein n=2 Tax=Zea mays TaxID=4577 RepID=A0A1D6E4T0_MAIZE|nr:late embryogenesis abundant protein [Zea mays]